MRSNQLAPWPPPSLSLRQQSAKFISADIFSCQSILIPILIFNLFTLPIVCFNLNFVVLKTSFILQSIWTTSIHPLLWFNLSYGLLLPISAAFQNCSSSSANVELGELQNKSHQHSFRSRKHIGHLQHLWQISDTKDKYSPPHPTHFRTNPFFFLVFLIVFNLTFFLVE